MTTFFHSLDRAWKLYTAGDPGFEEPLRVRFIGFGRYFLEVEIFCYAQTNDWPEFLEIRGDVLLKVMEIIERSGTRLALPTEIHYVNGDSNQLPVQKRHG